jgi:hypothetical protein
MARMFAASIIQVNHAAHDINVHVFFSRDRENAGQEQW